MLFILYSEIDAAAIASNLGRPEYSYYFVLRGFRRVLETLGDVVVVRDPAAEVDAIYRENVRLGQTCVFVSFSSPNKTLTTLSCPTVCVFAWGFGNIPDEVWDDDPRNDWRTVLAQLGSAITLSTFTEQTVRRQLGADFHIAAIPVPMPMPICSEPVSAVPLLGTRILSLDCTIIDSRFYRVGNDNTFVADIPANYFKPCHWSGERIELGFKLGDEDSGLLGGFHEQESWGAWSCIADPWILLPFNIVGRCKLEFELSAYGRNVGAVIQVGVAGQSFPLTLTEDLSSTEFIFDVQQPANLIQFSGLDTSTLPDTKDLRSMGIGVRRIWLERETPLTAAPVDTKKSVPLQLSFEGVVYTSVLNPSDHRKNWLEMLTAFCYAFRAEPRATLVLKMTHHSLGSFLGQFHFMLQRIGPMQCRVVLLHGYLEQTHYRQLIAATTFYVNTSHCEGFCLPLLEFMGDGIPALAPCHTAMRDYVNANNAFIIESGLEPASWPQDSRNLLRSLRYRLDWQAIVKAYQDSFQLALDAPEQYRRMSENARRAQRDFCAEEIVREKLGSFFKIGGAEPAIDVTALLHGRSAS